MITYTKTNFLETLLKRCYNLFDLHILLFSSASVLFTYLVTVLNEEVEGFDLNKHAVSLSSILSVFNFFFATLLSFRLNSAFNSWSNGYGNVTKLINASKRLICILSTTKDATFVLNMKSLITSYISYVFYFCNNKNGRLDVDGLRQPFLSQQQMYIIEQYDHMMNYEKEKSILESNLDSTIVLSSVEKDMRNLIATYKKDEVLNFFEAENLNALVTTIANLGETIFNMANIPIVLVYNQFINLTITLYLIVYSLNIVITSQYYSGIWVFIWSTIVFMANNVCNQIDTPFGDEENDIELEIVLLRFKKDIEYINVQDIHMV